MLHTWNVTKCESFVTATSSGDFPMSSAWDNMPALCRAEADAEAASGREASFCVLPSGDDQNDCVIKLDAMGGHSAARQLECLAQCAPYGAHTG
jgi:hypothetical protein